MERSQGVGLRNLGQPGEPVKAPVPNQGILADVASSSGTVLDSCEREIRVEPGGVRVVRVESERGREGSKGERVGDWL